MKPLLHIEYFYSRIFDDEIHDYLHNFYDIKCSSLLA